MKVAVYARVSTEEQSQGTSLQVQLEELRRKATTENWSIYHEYIDEASGTTDNREALKRLMLDAKAKRFEVVVVTKLDRFMRKLKFLLDRIEELDELGIAFISSSEGFNTNTAQGRFTLQIMGIIAEWERQRIIERTRSGRKARYSQKQWASGQPLYGYRYNPDTRKLDVREDEATIVRRIFNLYVFERLGVEPIARLLNKENIKPRQQARMWYSGAIKDTIAHSGYQGEHPLGIDLPAIVEPAVWHLAQARRKDNRRLHNRNGSPSWLLQGLIKCGMCGHSLSCSYAHNTRRVYSCRGRLLGSKPDNADKCHLKPLDAEWLENAVWGKVTEAFSNPTSLMVALNDHILKLKARQGELESTIKPINERLAEIKEKKAKLAMDWVQDAVGKETLDRLLKELNINEEKFASIRDEIDPAQIEELETTRYWLQFWQKSKRELDLRLSFVPEGELNEEEKQREQASKVADVLLGFADLEAPELNGEVGTPTTKRKLLDYLQCSIVPYPDRIEIKAFLPINHILYQQDYNSTYRSGRYRQSRYKEAAGGWVSP